MCQFIGPSVNVVCTKCGSNYREGTQHSCKVSYVLQRPNYKGDWTTDGDFGPFNTKKQAELMLGSVLVSFPCWSWRIAKL